MIDDSNKIRLRLIEAVRKNLVGPNTGGSLVHHYMQKHPELGLQPNDEILVWGIHDTPQNFYKSGKLHPLLPDAAQAEQNGQNMVPPDEPDAIALPPNQNAARDQARGTGAKEDSDTDEEINAPDPLQLANSFNQASMGFTVAVNKGAKLTITHKAASYVRQGAEHPLPEYRSVNGNWQLRLDEQGNQRNTENWWKRMLHEVAWEPEIDLLWNDERTPLIEQRAFGQDGQQIEFRLIKRRVYKDRSIFTISVVNTGRNTLYQNELSVAVENGEILPNYNSGHPGADQDQRLMDLLYRNHTAHAIGHGCSVRWAKEKGNTVKCVHSDFLPVYSLAPVEPNMIEGLDLAMWCMSQPTEWGVARNRLKQLIKGYEGWVTNIGQQVDGLDQRYQDTANQNIDNCEQALKRMKAGLALLDTDEGARKCFHHMNEAMLWQQQRSKVPQRKWAAGPQVDALPELFRNDAGGFKTLEEYQGLNPSIGRWRPFQLAFVLMNLSGAWDPKHGDRKLVDLIWFPTGGGKTEAYLGLAAFTIFARRVRNEAEHKGGTTVLMRYTLRLLTTQQFERAASLILACDRIRITRILRGGPVRIGLWVGGANTPNTNEDALHAFAHHGAGYHFILRKCPCCGAEMGPTAIGLKGLHAEADQVRFRCNNNPQCEYSNVDLPIYVVDEQIYNDPPTLVIGTVDKFAGIPWKSQNGNQELISKLFGFRGNVPNVTRIKPPDLIIQDELHLIAGPLGSMVGMYETLVKELCTDHERYQHPFIPEPPDLGIPPKIVASSATITRASDQVQALYGTDQLQIFPPQGIEIGETWFSKMDDTRCAEVPHLHKHGRWYVGFCPADSVLTPIYRTYASVLQEHADIEDGGVEARDRYHTLVAYFNSIRELSRAKTLLGDSVPEFLGRLKLRRNLITQRILARVEELTSRVDNSEIPAILKRMEVSGNNAVDVCMATNMIATGLDVQRLSLMFIHGQPKTTAEYIQASSRVGRDTANSPGLVFMHYNMGKPRDRSIYEHFQAYHEKLYAQVEPTSVTPFSIRVRERALHAIFFALVRHYSKHMRGNISYQREQDVNFFDRLIEYVSNVINSRARQLMEMHQLDQQDLDNINLQLQHWKNRLATIGDAGRWGDQANRFLEEMHWADGHCRQTLMMSISKTVPEFMEPRTYCLPTPTSMRQVDGISALQLPQ